MSNSDNSLNALSPLDGRYHSQLIDLSQLFSEHSLIKKRIFIEISYILFLAEQKIIPNFTNQQKKVLRNAIISFNEDDAKKVKSIEAKIKHDVKAVEYYLRDFFIEQQLPNNEYIHIALTSEDINSLAYSLLLQEAQQQIVVPTLKKVLRQLLTLANKYASTPLLARTHGQPAVPTTVGKELFVFAHRLYEELKLLEKQKIEGKLTGAVGNFNAHVAVFPNIDWLDQSKSFVQSLDLLPNLITTQILPAETYTRFFCSLLRINTILLDLNQDLWRYISDGVFLQSLSKKEVGSSTMPQKVNPIDFENSEGNLGIANALFNFFIQKLPISRLQRDLSDSTVKRNFGSALGYCQLAYNSLEKGLKKISVDEKKLSHEINEHWEVIAEGLQVILKSHGHSDAYEQLKNISRGNQLSEKNISLFIDSLNVEEKIKQQLKEITPLTYTGYAQKIVIDNLPSINSYLEETDV